MFKFLDKILCRLVLRESQDRAFLKILLKLAGGLLRKEQEKLSRLWSLLVTSSRISIWISALRFLVMRRSIQLFPLLEEKDGRVSGWFSMFKSSWRQKARSLDRLSSRPLRGASSLDVYGCHNPGVTQ
ncbi:hypothetical protein CDAR_397291 [Caerostris darwini]|uniref:Uncharacterized protein n=1 Tax=Caerostris darwini TaxID=1538125 RepID=A0AAV4PLA5_9ARAC|nr:hypothetical protein CDAR_397291 [Caerostris darwini]